MNSSSTPEGPGSVAGAPYLPDGFTGTFTSRYLDTAGLRQHVVTGGAGPPLLLIHGWPQTWYAWRLVMPALARDFTVVAPDQRGTGLSGKPGDGYDTATLAGDLAALMGAWPACLLDADGAKNTLRHPCGLPDSVPGTSEWRSPGGGSKDAARPGLV